jgi:DeoR/GlpR family transcriptional regulator of sugar metabolism
MSETTRATMEGPGDGTPTGNGSLKGGTRMPAERRRSIEAVLVRRGLVGTQELAELTGVSTVTLRRDLEALTKEGVIERTRGGARLLARRAELDEIFATRERLLPDEKRRIGLATVSCLRPGEVLGMNDGSTVMQVAREIVDSRIELMVATNALNVALVLLESEALHVTVVGGLLRRASFGTYSPMDDSIASVRFDSVVLGIAGMDAEAGIAMHHPFDMIFARRLVDRANRVIVVADSTKWSAGGYAHVAGWDEVDLLVTDSVPPRSPRGSKTDVVVAADL